MTKTGGENTSMSRWCKDLSFDNRNRKFILNLQKEESKKRERLLQTLNDAGLPPTLSYTFDMPDEQRALIERCETLQSAGWLLTTKIIDKDSKNLLFRALDSDLDTLKTGLKSLEQKTGIVVVVTPNSPPTLSGTLLAREGNAILEIVHGPHHWLTKTPPDQIDILRCEFEFPHIHVNYSIESPSHRSMLFQHLRAVVKIGLGVSLSQLAASKKSLYAEFQWHQQFGYKFFDISEASVWVGCD